MQKPRKPQARTELPASDAQSKTQAADSRPHEEMCTFGRFEEIPMPRFLIARESPPPRFLLDEWLELPEYERLRRLEQQTSGAKRAKVKPAKAGFRAPGSRRWRPREYPVAAASRAEGRAAKAGSGQVAPKRRTRNAAAFPPRRD